jgi:hypothetical protein
MTSTPKFITNHYLILVNKLKLFTRLRKTRSNDVKNLKLNECQAPGSFLGVPFTDSVVNTSSKAGAVKTHPRAVIITVTLLLCII